MPNEYVSSSDELAILSGEAVRIDATYPAGGTSEASEGGPDAYDIDPLPGGGFIATWQYDRDGDDQADGLVIQRVDAQGRAVGAPIPVTGVPGLVFGNGYERFIAASVDPLADGGYALSYATGAPVLRGVSMTSNIPLNGTLYRFVGTPEGRPLYWDVSGITDPTQQYVLIGTGMQGQLLTVSVTPQNGRITLTQDQLDLFAADDKISLGLTVSSGTNSPSSVPVYYAVQATETYRADSPLVTTALTTNAPITVNNLTFYNLTLLNGRGEIWHVQNYADAAAMQLNVRLSDPERVLSALGMSGMLYVAGSHAFTGSDGTNYLLQVVIPGSVQNFVVLNVVPDSTGTVRAPQSLLNALGDSDAGLSLQLRFNSVPVNAPTATVEARQPTELPTGYFLQHLDASGAAQGAAVRIDSSTAPIALGNDDPPFVRTDVLPDGRIVTIWLTETSPGSENQTLAMQVFAANGDKIGGPTLLELDPDIAAWAMNSDSGAFAIEALSNGRFVLALDIEPRSMYNQGGLISAGTNAYQVIIGAGRPSLFDVNPVNDPSATYFLTGYDASGNAVSVPVSRDANGIINVTQQLLDLFASDARINLRVESTTNLAGRLVWYEIEDIWTFPAGGATHDVAFSRTSPLSGGLSLGDSSGKFGSLHFDTAIFKAGQAHTVSFLVWTFNTWDLANRLGLGNSSTAVVDGLTYTRQQVGSTNQIAIRVTVPIDANGNVSLPPALAAAIGTSDAKVAITVNNLEPSTSVTGHFTMLDPSEVPAGLHLQVFGADGHSIGDPVRIDTASQPFWNYDGDVLLDVTQLSDGTAWVAYATGGDNPDSPPLAIIMRHVDASGHAIGDPVTLDNLAPEILLSLANGSFSGSVTPLEDGGFAVLAQSGVETNWVQYANATVNPGLALIGGIGEPLWFEVPPGQPGQSGWSYFLRGSAEDGSIIRVQVTPDANGRITVTQALLDSFTNDARISLEIDGVSDNQLVNATVQRAETWGYRDSNPVVETAIAPYDFQPLLSTLYPAQIRDAHYTLLTSNDGRIEAFHVGQLSTIASPIRFIALNINVSDIYEVAAKLGIPPSFGAPLTVNGMEIRLSQNGQVGGSAGSIQFPNIMPDANGNIVVPQFILNALGYQDAAVNVFFTGYALDPSVTPTVTVRQPTELRQGLLVQEFDVTGHARLTGGPVNIGEVIEGGTAIVDGSSLADADGIASIAYRWQHSSDGGQTWTNITGATGERYDVTAADRGTWLRIAADVTDDRGTVETRYSDPQEVASLEGGAGNDRLVGTAQDDYMQGQEGNDTIGARDGNDIAYGQAGNDSILGEGGNDTLWGGDGNDTLSGGAGNDNLFGEAGNDSVSGGDGNDMLDGGAGNDTLSGDFGNDTLLGGDGNNSLSGGDGNDLVRGGKQADELYGDTGNDTIQGDAGNDSIDGGAGADQMWGGAGDDTYYVDNSADRAIETTTLSGSIDAGGRDLVIATASFDLGASNGMRYVENLLLKGPGNIDGSGNALANLITGNAGNNVLDGRAGADTMAGGLGNDTYVVDVAGDVINEDADAGIDTVNAAISYTLGTTLENLTLTGTSWTSGTGNAAANRLVGNSGNNQLTGLAGNDTLVGSGGNDTMDGGEGNDTFEIGLGSGFDSFIGGAGTDRIVATVNNAVIGYQALSSIEEISANGFSGVSLRGTDVADVMAFTGIALNGIAMIDGGAGNDSITGTANADYLFGGFGADTLVGGAGNDTFGVDNVGDQVVEVAGGGTADAVASTLTTYSIVSLGNIENLIYIGTGNAAMTGNSLANEIYGGSGNDTLDGGTGNDTLFGNGGDDVYIVDSAGDTIVDTGGNDTVRAKIGWTLQSGIEGLELLVAGTGTGNEGNNSITGSTGADTLYGMGGNDTIGGAAGADVLYGGDGNDVFLMAAGGGADTFYGGNGFDTILLTATNLTLNFTVFSSIERVSAGATGSATIAGSGGNDTMDFTGVELISIAAIDGGSGNDSIIGSAGNDTIIGNFSNDTMEGGDGNDTFLIGASSSTDAISGGSGQDRILATADNAVLGLSSISSIETIDAGGKANFRISGSGVGDNLDFSATTLIGVTAIDGGSGNDTLIGSAGNDTLIGSFSNDTMDGGDGNDVFQIGASTATDSINGGNGTDRIVATVVNAILGLSALSSVEQIDSGGNTGFKIAGTVGDDSLDFSSVTLTGVTAIEAGAGNDTIVGSSAADTVNGGAGNDSLNGGDGNDIFQIATVAGIDTINGGNGTDRIVATAANAVLTLGAFSSIEAIDAAGLAGFKISGTTGDDTLDFTSVTLTGVTVIDGGLGSDVLTGSAGNDTLLGGAGNDTLNGGAGADTFQIGTGSGTDVINGGAGQDKILAVAANATLTVASFSSTNAIEQIDAGGNAGFRISGTSGNDSLDFSTVTLTSVTAVDGGAGNDALIGSAAADTLIGGAGIDTLTGGAGRDVFVFKATTESARGASDVIRDFVHATDIIDLSAIDGDGSVGTANAFRWIGSAAFSGSAGELHYLLSNGKTVIEGDTNGDKVADIVITLDTNPALDAADFIL